MIIFYRSSNGRRRQDAFNNSSDSIIIIGDPGKATPKASQAGADLVFWDTP